VAALGPAVSAVPLGGLRLVVGALLLVFGLQWLRKAILRASGHKALHDEDKIFAEQLRAAASKERRRAGLVPDLYGFTLSFKGVLLEGLEVVFIVLTFGANQHDIGLAAVAGACAVAVVVGIMLTGFGTFWGAEGAGAHWPGSDASLLALIPAIGAFALILVAVMRGRAGHLPSRQTAVAAAAPAGERS
jgi:uncharacterized membrane protein